MKHIAIPIIAFLAVAAATATEQRFSMRMASTPLRYVLDDYAEKSGKHVDIVVGVRAAVTIESKDLTRAEYLHLIESELENVNIGLFQIASNRVVAAWIDLGKVPPPTKRLSFAERLERRRREETSKGDVQHQPAR